jgi:hypothetical protein
VIAVSGKNWWVSTRSLIILILLEIAIGILISGQTVTMVCIVIIAVPVAVLLLLRPFYAYLIGLLLLPFWTITLTGGGQEIAGQVDFRFADVVFIMSGIGVAAKIAMDKEFKPLGSPLDISLILLFLWMGLSFFWSVSVSASLVDYTKKIYGLAIFYITLNVVRSRKDLNKVLLAWTVTGLVLALVGLHELFTTGLNLAEFIAGKTIKHWGEPVRASAFAENPNKLAFALGVSMLVAFTYYSVSRGRGNKIGVFVGIALMLVVFITTLSRTSWIAFAVTIVMLFLLSPRVRWPCFSLGFRHLPV